MMTAPHPSDMSSVENSMRSMQLKPQFEWNLNAPSFVPRFQNATPVTSAPNDYPTCSMGGGTWSNQNNSFQGNDMSNTSFDESWLSAPSVMPRYPESLQLAFQGQEGQLLQEIQVGLEQLLSKPDELDIWSEAIRDRLPYNNNEALGYVAQMIVEMALCCPNSGYLIGRLCRDLCADIEPFRGHLLTVCHKEDEKYQTAIHDPVRFRNFVQLMGELYVSVDNATKNRIEILGAAVCGELILLLHNPTDEENIKCMVRVLKCTGSALEASEQSRNSVATLITKLMDMTRTFPVSDGLLNQVQGLLELRAKNWESSSNVAQSRISGLTMPGTPMYCGPDGIPLTQEERSFLEENLGRLDSTTESNEDFEIQAAYAEFLANQQSEQK